MSVGRPSLVILAALAPEIVNSAYVWLALGIEYCVVGYVLSAISELNRKTDDGWHWRKCH